jgi:hypothetical protein
MAKKPSPKIEIEPTTGLTYVEPDRLWVESAEYRGITDEESIAQSLSGDDPEAARAYLHWLQVSIRDEKPMQPTVREYARQALHRFMHGGVTLGEAFGTERRKRGARPMRAGAKSAVIGLIRFLHEQRKFPLSDGRKGPSAFLVAATILSTKLAFLRSPTTLRDEYWNQRDKGD